MKRDDTRHWFLQHLALGQIWNKTSLVSLLNPSSRSVSALLRFKWNMRQRRKIIILQNWLAHNKVLLSADGNWHFCPNTMEKNTTDKIVSYKGRPHFPRGALSNTLLLKTQQWCSSDSFGVHTEEQKLHASAACDTRWYVCDSTQWCHSYHTLAVQVKNVTQAKTAKSFFSCYRPALTTCLPLFFRRPRWVIFSFLKTLFTVIHVKATEVTAPGSVSSRKTVWIILEMFGLTLFQINLFLIRTLKLSELIQEAFVRAVHSSVLTWSLLW